MSPPAEKAPREPEEEQKAGRDGAGAGNGNGADAVTIPDGLSAPINGSMASMASCDDEEDHEMRRMPWREAKHKLRPSQMALGYDWAFFKLNNFPTAEAAQAYMDRKPVPCVQRGRKWYTVDHHHTLAALELSGYDEVVVTLERVHKVDKAAYSKAAFWGYMEGRGWAFCRDEAYLRVAHSKLPKDYRITSFRNDIYRSIGGFLRTHDVLKRGKRLSDRAFFEFKWGYFFWLHRHDAYGLWPDLDGHSKFLKLLEEIESIELPAEAVDEGEGDTEWWTNGGPFESGSYEEEGHIEVDVIAAAKAHGLSCDNEEECNAVWADYKEHVEPLSARKARERRFARLTKHSETIAQPLYLKMATLLRGLCEAYAALPEDQLDVPGLRDIFGTSKCMPGRVIGVAQWQKDESK